jgi:hypothetical protein
VRVARQGLTPFKTIRTRLRAGFFLADAGMIKQIYVGIRIATVNRKNWVKTKGFAPFSTSDIKARSLLGE